MEGGSLLEQALSSQAERETSTKNVLIMEVYPLKDHRSSKCNDINLLQELAGLAQKCNSYLQSKSYLWHYGGDGPIFGVYVGSEKIPHLRALCHYGPSVSDEWVAIEIMWEMSTSLNDDIAVSCWDVEDGQVMLIQAAEALPDWLDTDPTDNHRHACWIRNGSLQLIPQPHAKLDYALKWLIETGRSDASAYPRIHDVLKKTFRLNREQGFAQQRLPLVVPRKVAFLIRRRPDLLHSAIQEFCEHIEDPAPDLLQESDWVWATATVSKTNYAMLRTMVSSSWETTEFVPPCNVEVKRYKRQCASEYTPHIRHAVHLGVRVVVGLYYLARKKDEPFSMDCRVAAWTRIASETSTDSSWVVESFQQGPNNAKDDLSDILKCPVFPEEVKNLFLYSHADVSVRQQITNAQKNINEEEVFPVPLSDQVDGEEWLILDEKGEIQGATDLDSILSRFQNFMLLPSEVGGVEVPKALSREDIRPRVFLNILHAALKGESLSFLSSEEREDPYFFKEDYDLMEADIDDIPQAEASSMLGMMVNLQIYTLAYREFVNLAHLCPILLCSECDG